MPGLASRPGVAPLPGKGAAAGPAAAGMMLPSTNLQGVLNAASIGNGMLLAPALASNPKGTYQLVRLNQSLHSITLEYQP